MATTKQRSAARRNVKKAQAGARRKQTLKNLPSETRTALGKEAAAVRRGAAPTRKELEAEARKLDISGRAETPQPPASAKTIETSVPPSRGRRTSNSSATAAAIGSPNPTPGLSVLGLIPQPSSRTAT